MSLISVLHVENGAEFLNATFALTVISPVTTTIVSAFFPNLILSNLI